MTSTPDKVRPDPTNNRQQVGRRLRRTSGELLRAGAFSTPPTMTVDTAVARSQRVSGSSGSSPEAGRPWRATFH